MDIFSLVIFVITFLALCVVLHLNGYEKNLHKKAKMVFEGVLLVANLLFVNLFIMHPFFRKIDDMNQFWSQFLFLVSFVVFELAFFSLFWRNKTNFVRFAGIILISVFLFHLSLQIYSTESDLDNWSKILNAFANTFQTFTLDLNYKEDFLILINYAGDHVHNFGKTMVIIFTVLAPTTGGFVIMDVLANIFPSIKLFFVCFSPFKSQYHIFSELNECSIETAESIFKERNEGSFIRKIKDLFHFPLIIFTDAYTNANQEAGSELLERAKKIGAICLKIDILEFKLLFRRKIKTKEYSFYFMDKKEENNIKDSVALMLTDNGKPLLEKHYVKNFKKHQVKLYIFIQNSEAHKVISLAREELVKYADSETFIECNIINEYKNLVYRLINGWNDDEDFKDNEHSYPLYYAKGCGSADQSIDVLHICVIGSGRIGSEFIKATYMCGQILKKPNEQITSELHIHIYSKEADSTKSKLKFEMPEINFDTKDSYACFHFVNLEYGTNPFEEQIKKDLGKFDYILVALGNDNLNYEAANWLKRMINNEITENEEKKIPINYIVEDKKLCDVFNTKNQKSNKSKNNHVILNAFGSLKSRYKIQNVVLEQLRKEAISADFAYEFTKNDQTFEEAKKALLKDVYKINSSLATALYMPYKLYSINRKKELKRSNVENFEYASNLETILYWIEHKRWVAYMRTIGYRCPTPKEFARYAKIEHNSEKSITQITEVKNVDFKLHACMIEGDGEYQSFLPNPKITETDIENYLKQLENEDGSLEDALKKVISSNKKEDSLDRLSKLSNSNYKDFDINITRNIIKERYAQILTTQLDKNKNQIDANLLNQLPNLFEDSLMKNASGSYCKKDDDEFIFVTSWNKNLFVLANVNSKNKANYSKTKTNLQFPNRKKSYTIKQLPSPKLENNNNFYLIILNQAKKKNNDLIFSLEDKSFNLKYNKKDSSIEIERNNIN